MLSGRYGTEGSYKFLKIIYGIGFQTVCTLLIVWSVVPALGYLLGP